MLVAVVQVLRMRMAIAAGALAALSLTAFVSAAPASGAPASASHVSTYLSAPAVAAPEPELLVPPAPVAEGEGSAQGSEESQPSYLLLAPIQAFSRKAPFFGKPGPMLMEADGNLVWQLPLGNQVKMDGVTRKIVAMDLHAATYEGHNVLVWWQGYITPQGFGNGAWKIVDQHYNTLATITAPAGYSLDFHDIQLTKNGMAYIFGGREVKIGLGCCGGSKTGALYDQVLFEVNVKTGKVVWKWDPLNHVPLRESYSVVPPSKPWDPYHLNSISLGPSGSLIISARNTWAAYWVTRSARHNGQVFATLGGKRSSFKLGKGARFAWQHDVSQLAGEQVSIFDDEAAPVEAKQSRGLTLNLDFQSHSATVAHTYLLPKPELAGSQGSMEVDPDGGVFVGWGQLPYFSEYASSGKLVYEGELPGSDESYRAYRSSWIGMPKVKPAIAVRSASGRTVNVYASWNGATQVVAWQLMAGPSPTNLAPVGQPVQREGFETTIATRNAGPDYVVQALSRAGKVLGISRAVTLAG